MKRHLFLVIAALLALPFNLKAQSLDYNATLPEDKTIIKGVLENGLTYYIKYTDVVKGSASYYIMQNVGSILENDDQQGLAHFLEHMAFNGTEHFPGKGIINTLQEHGAVFGKDINAYTSFDETVYNLSNIPTKNGLVDTCLTILQDWCNYLSLTDEEIDNERGVIKEEWRTRQTPRARLYEKSMPIIYNNSKYAERPPIGLMSVVENFDYKSLRDFYHDWYRTDLQAIAIIGDIDVDEVEEKIKEKFSQIPAVENPKERFIIDIPESTGLSYNLGMDPEVGTTSLTFGIRHENQLGSNTIADFRKMLLEGIAVRSLYSRILEKRQDPKTAYIKASVGYGGLSRTSKVFSLIINPKPNRQKEAFKEVLTEVMRAVKYGYTQSEIERAIKVIESSYQNSIANKGDESHASIQRNIQNNYLLKNTMTDIEQEYEIAMKILENTTANEVHNTIKRLYAVNNRYLNIIGVKGSDNLSKEEALEIIKSVENDDMITPYSENLDGKNLLSDLSITPGKIDEVKTNSELGSKTFVLSNGIEVHYKYADKQKNSVALKGLSYGGTSLLNDEDLPSAGIVNQLITRSGLVNFSAADLKKVLAGKTASVGIGLGSIDESISGNSNTKDVETMLQMVHAYFVKPRFDQDAFKVLKTGIDNYLYRKSKDVNAKIKDSLTYTIYGKDHPRKRLFDQDYVNDISFEKIKSIYLDRFDDASDFEFFIVGDVSEEDLTPLLEQYLASIPTKNTREDYLDKTVDWISNTIKRDIYMPMESPKAVVNIHYKKEMPYSREHAVYTNVIGDILQLRVTETVREAEGGAYSPKANASFEQQPKPVANIWFKFDCNPDMVDNLVSIVNKELDKITEGEINEDDLEKTKTNLIKEFDEYKNSNGYDMRLLTKYYRYDENINDPNNYLNIVKAMTIEDVKKMANVILQGAESYQIIIKPEQS